MADLPKKRSIGKKLLIAVGVLFALLVVVYLVGTSTAFLKGVILPRVSKSVGAEITVADASISPFSRVELEKLKVQPPNAEPILQADKVIARYSLMDIIGGKIVVHEVTMDSPIIRIVEDAKGNSNLDALTKGATEKPAEPAAKKEEKPAQIAIRNVSLKNATIQAIKKHEDGRDELTELSNLNLNIDQLANGQPGKLDIASNLKMQNVGTNGTANLLDGSVNGKFDYALTKDLAPQSLKGIAQIATKNATGAYGDLAGFGATLTADLSPTDIKALALQFSQRDQQLGQLRVSGPFDANKREGKLKVEVADIDRRVLNIVGTPKGIDFGPTKINSTSDIELSKGGDAIAINGELVVNSFSITQTNQTTPKVDLTAKYNLNVDQPNKSAVINAFTLAGTQNKQALLNAALSKPMKLQWGETSDAVDESAFVMTVTNLNLADWKAFAADLNPSGTAGLKLTVVSQKAGKEIQFDLNSRLNKFSASFGTNKIDNADITAIARGRLSELDRLNLEESRVELAQGGTRALTLSASGQYATKSQEADLKAELEGALPKLLQLVQIPETDAKSGQLTFNGKITQKGANQTIAGKLALIDFTGRNGEYKLRDFNVTADADIQKLNDMVQIKKLAAAIKEAKQEAGTLDVTGNYNLKTEIGTIELALKNLNEAALRPFAAPSLGERKLESIAINGKATANLNSTNSSAVLADLKVSNVVISEPGQKTPPPLGANLDVNILLQNKVSLQIQRFAANVDYGGKPAGMFDVAGNYNLDTQRGKIDLKLTGLNQNAVKPFMPKLGDKDLVTISINGSATANLNSTNGSAFKADFKVSDLVVKDPKKKEADPALSAQLILDAAMAKQVVDLRQLQLNLSPTQRAKNQLDIKGRIDTSNTNAYQGNLAISSDSLDLTSFYNLSTGTDETGKSTQPAGGASTTPTSDANQEPEPMKLPVKEFVLDVNIGKLFLRELAITNLVASGKLATDRLVLNPMQMSINGGAVKGNIDLNLGVRGYAYKIALSADKVPLEPVANTFAPEKRGQFKGDILANIDVKGAGTTGVNLKKTLDANVVLTFTNANIQISGSRFVMGILKPTAAFLGLSELTESPISLVHSEVKIGGGTINLQRADIQSEALQAGMKGVIPIADVLTNSPLNNLPLDIAVRRTLAPKVPKELRANNVPPDAAYVPLERFVTVGGTLGNPKPKYTELTKLAIKEGTKILEKQGGDLGKAVGGVLSGFLGSKQPQQPQTGTNQPPGAKQSPAQTNQPPKTNAPPKKPSLFDLIPK